MATRTESLVGKLSIEDAEWRAGLARASSQFKAFAGQIGTGLGSAFKGGLAGMSSFVSGAGGMLRGLLSGIGELASALGIGGLLSAGGIVAGMKSIADLGGELKDTSDRTGIAIDQLVILQEQLRQGGIEAGAVTTYVKKLNEALLDGNKKDLFEALGLDPAKLRASSPVSQINAILSAVRQLKDVGSKQGVLGKIFGARQGIQLMTLVNDKDSEAAAKKMVGSLAAEMKKSAGDFDTVSDTLFGGIPIKLRQAFAGFTSSLLPLLLPIADMITNMDLGPIGKRLGEQLVWAYRMFSQLWQDGTIWKAAGLYLQKAFIVATSFFATALDQTLRAVFSWSNMQFLTTLIDGAGMYLAGVLQEQLADMQQIPWMRDRWRAEGAKKKEAAIMPLQTAAAGLIQQGLPRTFDAIGSGIKGGQTLPIFADWMKSVQGEIDTLRNDTSRRAGVSAYSPIEARGLPGAMPEAPRRSFEFDQLYKGKTNEAGAPTVHMDKILEILSKGAVTVKVEGGGVED